MAVTFFGKSFAPRDFEKSLRIWFTFSCFLKLFCVGARESYESDGFTHLGSPGLVFGCHFFGKSFAPMDLEFPHMIWFKISVWDEGLGRPQAGPRADTQVLGSHTKVMVSHIWVAQG